jgi:GNAT superfamily N-acetyltransferase
MSCSGDLWIESCAGGVTTHRFEKAERADIPPLRRFATQVYDVSFHDKHREPAKVWMQRLLQPGGEPIQHASLLLRSRADQADVPEMLAGALSETYRGGVVLLTYIVVHPERRGRGLGSRLMREVWEKHAGSTEGCDQRTRARTQLEVAAAARGRTAPSRGRF